MDRSGPGPQIPVWRVPPFERHRRDRVEAQGVLHEFRRPVEHGLDVGDVVDAVLGEVLVEAIFPVVGKDGRVHQAVEVDHLAMA